jgi:hypothetical protein
LHPSNSLMSFSPQGGTSSGAVLEPPEVQAGTGAATAGVLLPPATLGVVDQRYDPIHHCHQDTNGL